MNFRKAYTHKLPQLSRKSKIIRNLFLSAVTVFLIYIFLGAPAFSPEQAFRREEKRHFVGPAEILAVIDVDNEHYNKLIIADDGDAVILYPVYDLGRIYYRKKAGDATVLAAPTYGGFPTETKQALIVLFTEIPHAQRAVLELSLHAELNGLRYEGSYLLEAEREHKEFFLFTLSPVAPEYYAQAELYAIHLLQRKTDDRSPCSGTFPARISFYDANGRLIAERERSFASAF
ncbi:MAG TPA: hypothetical protein GX699_08275 [Firmicutes bacterium]|nr:hypothetical protein [Bacillota bacterium]